MIDNLQTIAELYRYSTERYAAENWSFSADSDLQYTYKAFKELCDRLSDQLSRYGVGAGDKVAIYSSGTPHWSAAFFTATAFGRVSVPILPDFSGPEAEHVLVHSETKALFVSKRLLGRISQSVLDSLALVIDIDTLETISCGEEVSVPAATADPAADDLAAIIYTSGTTGAAKGVMLQHKNFMANLRAGIRFYPLHTDDVLLSVLPLAHTYELSLGMLYPFSCGSSVGYISKPPTPSYLVKTMKSVRPTAMLTVPLIIEKVFKGTIVPQIKGNPLFNWMSKYMSHVLALVVGKRMIKTFGGRLKFFGIGGAKLDVDVERFLHKARFPYYIGYGLTECAPLLAFCAYHETVPGQIGRPVYGVELRLDNINPATGEGEIVARGENIMPGYYKDPERTADAFTADGWFCTRDIASVDSKGRYAIKGRIGNMIVGSNGENIYPEEIEKVIKEVDNVEDAIVVSRGRGLVALVKVADKVFDFKSLDLSDAAVLASVEEFKTLVKDYVNARVSASSRVNVVELMKEPFDKTATLKIRRFLYIKESNSI